MGEIPRLRPRPTGSPWDVLVIEPDAGHAGALVDYLETLGCLVTHHTSAVSGAAATRKTVFDAVFSIIGMRRMDAYELCFEMRNDDRTKRVPFILIQSADDRADPDTCARLQIEHVIDKPVSLSDVAQILQGVLPHQQPMTRDDTNARSHVAHRKLEQLGIDVQFDPEGAAWGAMTLKHVQLDDPVNERPIRQILLRATTPLDTRVLSPPLMARLPPIPLIDLPDREALERFLEAAWNEWLEGQRGALEMLDRFGVEFRANDVVGVVARTIVDDREVVFSFQDARTLIIESYASWSLKRAVLSPARMLHLDRGVSSRIELDAAILAFLDRNRDQLAMIAEDEDALELATGPRELEASDLVMSGTTGDEDPLDRSGPVELDPAALRGSASAGDEEGASHLFSAEDLAMSRQMVEEFTDDSLQREEEFELSDHGESLDLADEETDTGGS